MFARQHSEHKAAGRIVMVMMESGIHVLMFPEFVLAKFVFPESAVAGIMVTGFAIVGSMFVCPGGA
jgi:hypothetical protein